ncbi:hypothetical protein CEY12_06025 [Chryseobacterium sp. T16E-39]|nr:hypothetical protein CEY12_06025 [Chryseobacterium sp. T16E-39]
MNLYHRIKEVRNHIDDLQQIANKHKANNKIHSYNRVCDTIKENKLNLKVLNEDLVKHNRILLYRIHAETH